MVSQTGPRVVRSKSCKGPVYPGKGAKKSQRAKRNFWGQKVLFGTKFLKFGPKKAKLETLTDSNICTKSTDCKGYIITTHYKAKKVELSRYYCNNEWHEYHPKNTKRQNINENLILQWQTKIWPKKGQILQNGQMRFFMASAVKKWPNFWKFAIKWPIWQPCYCVKNISRRSLFDNVYAKFGSENVSDIYSMLLLACLCDNQSYGTMFMTSKTNVTTHVRIYA